jgi:hypothetical protein
MERFEQIYNQHREAVRAFVRRRAPESRRSAVPAAEKPARRYANGFGVASTLGIETRAIVLNGDG